MAAEDNEVLVRGGPKNEATQAQALERAVAYNEDDRVTQTGIEPVQEFPRPVQYSTNHL